MNNKYNIGDLFTNGKNIFYIHRIEYNKYQNTNYYFFTHLDKKLVQTYMSENEIEYFYDKRRGYKYYPVK
jgi:hypothetical protein